MRIEGLISDGLWKVAKPLLPPALGTSRPRNSGWRKAFGTGSGTTAKCWPAKPSRRGWIDFADYAGFSSYSPLQNRGSMAQDRDP